MRTLILALLLTLSPALAGCIGSGADDPLASQATLESATLTFQERTAWGTDALVFPGPTLTGQGGGCSTPLLVFCLGGWTEPPCDGSNCATLTFELTVPEKHWERHEGALEVSALWTDDDWVATKLTVLGPDDQEVGHSYPLAYAATVLVPEAAPGTYTVEFKALYGTGAPTLVFQLESRPRSDEPRELLPNLVMMPPLDVHIPDEPVNVFGLGPAGTPVNEAIGLEGCDAWELAEQTARRCLRLTSSLGNLGDGLLEVRLTFEEGVRALAGAGQFVQRIHASDGSYRDVPVDGAVFHPTHAHFHYRDLAVFTLYTYDLETGTRGDAVAKTGKSGFCFFDMGHVLPGATGTQEPYFASEARCFLEPEEDWVTGVSPGWFDRYWSGLSDQYVEVTGLDDGTYELVATANGGGTLVEATLEDNAAGAILAISGDEVQVLGTWAGYLGGPENVRWS